MNAPLRTLNSLGEHQPLLPEASTLLQKNGMNVSDAKKRTLQDICEYLFDHDIDNGLYEQLIATNIIGQEDVNPTFVRKRYVKEALYLIVGVDPILPQVETLVKVSHYVVQLYESDEKSEVLRPLPSLIGLTGMISLFHQYVCKKITPQTMWDNLDRLLPIMSQLPYLKTSRSCSEEAINELTHTTIPDNLSNPEEFLLGIRNIQQIIIRYPIVATLDHIKGQLEKYQQSLEPSLVELLCHQHYEQPMKQTTSMYEAKVDEIVSHAQTQKSTKAPRKQREKTVKQPKPQVVDENGQIVKKKKRRFSEEETQNLIKGVEQYGVGHWKMILNNFKFDDRSCVDLKDKWRNLEFSRMRSNKQKQKEEQQTMEMEMDVDKPNILPSVENGMGMSDIAQDAFKYPQSD